MTDRTFEFLSLLAYLYLQHGQVGKAIDLLEPLAAERPANDTVALSLAYAYLEAGEHERCLQQVQRAQREIPGLRQSLPLRLIRSRALWKSGRKDQAMSLAREWSKDQGAAS